MESIVIKLKVFEGFLGVIKLPKYYIAIYSPIVTMVKPYSYHGENTAAADPSRRKRVPDDIAPPPDIALMRLRPSDPWISGAA